MTDLSTTYMGFNLDNPLIPGASPMLNDMDMVRRLEDAGAPLMIMHSMFEEQLIKEQVSLNWAMEHADYSNFEAGTFLPRPEEFRLGPDEYLRQIWKIKSAVSVPVIASLNGRSPGGWISYARMIQEAGADGIELNLYDMPVDPHRTSARLESDQLDTIRAVREAVSIPLAVKLSPFYSSPVNFARRAAQSGVNALVIFNRFYQSDIDIEELAPTRSLALSTSAELPLRLRWTAAMYGHVQADIAITGGVHDGRDVIRALMCGAQAVQMVSALLKAGPRHLAAVRSQISDWMQEHDYQSLRELLGVMSLQRMPRPELFERGNYIHILQSWSGE
ncbi:MAG: dihydroorotate dehydrogenase-like protein [Planctomycetia bacterium]|nr:dihydroorotate dehydrogenase-like protein [Planctomycetia bacterium]